MSGKCYFGTPKTRTQDHSLKHHLNRDLNQRVPLRYVLLILFTYLVSVFPKSGKR